MRSLAAPPRPGVRRHGQCMPPLTMHACRWILTGAAVCTSGAASESNAPVVPRFQLEGSGIVTVDQAVQKSATVQLRAFLTPDDAGEGATSNVVQGNRFAVSATLSAASLVCYNDTIFRDGFNGTGL
jgi:hypothetical protein